MKYCSLFVKNLRELLLSIDMFGSYINLQIKKEKEYHTFFGVLMSIGILTLIYYTFLSLVIDMMDSKNAKIFSNIQYSPFPEEYILEQDSFLFYIVVSDMYGQPIIQKSDSIIYRASMQACSQIVDEDNTINNHCYNFTLKSCASIQMNSQIQEQLNISTYIQTTSLCLDPKDLDSISLSLQGTPHSPIFKSIQFKIEKCNNSTTETICASEEYIDEKLSQGNLRLVFSDSYLNLQKANKPFSLVQKQITSTISTFQYKDISVWMRKQKLYNKENFFYYFEKNEEHKSLSFERQSEQTLNVSQQNKLIDITMFLDDREVVYYKTYNNILDILGQMSGLLNLLLFLVGTIVKPFNKLSCDLFLVSEIFQFQKSIDQQNINPQVQAEGLINKSQLFQLKDYLKTKGQQIKLFVHQYFFTSGNDRKLIQQSIETINNQFDIIYIINKLIEIDKLKKVLLNEDQQRLFNYIRKPKIQLRIGDKMKENINQNFFDENKISFEEQLIQAFNSYNIIKESQHKHKNQSLINLLDKDIQLIFETNDNQKLQNQSSIIYLQEVSAINDLSIQENRVDF